MVTGNQARIKEIIQGHRIESPAGEVWCPWNLEPNLLAHASAELVLAGLFQPRLADALIGFIVGRRPFAAGPDAATVRCHHMVWLWAIRRFAADASAELVLAGLFQPRLTDALIGFIVGRRPLAAGPDAATVLCQYVVWRRTCRLCAYLYCVCKK